MSTDGQTCRHGISHFSHYYNILDEVKLGVNRDSSGRVYHIVHHVARFDAVRPLCLSEYSVEDVMVLKSPFSRLMTVSDGVLIVIISREGAISSRNIKA